jgi:hypothetical protein
LVVIYLHTFFSLIPDKIYKSSKYALNIYEDNGYFITIQYNTHMVFLNSTMIMFIKLVAEEKFEDTKGLTRSYKLKDRQYNGQKKNDKKKNNDLQNITQKTID